MQDFGGLEEYAVELAAGLKDCGHELLVVSTAWTPPENQYRARIESAGIRLFQPPKWASMAASDWEFKQRLLRVITTFLSPLALLLAAPTAVYRGWSIRRALQGVRGRLEGLIGSAIRRDYRKAPVRMMLNLLRLRKRPDIIHVHGYTTNLLFVVDWAHRSKLPIVYEEHQTPDSRFDWWAEFPRVINKADRILACSRNSAESLKAVCRAARPVVVRPPLFPDPFGSSSSVCRPRRRTQAQLTVGLVGRLYVTKGLQYYLEAIARLSALYPDAVFKIHGEGPLRDELTAHAVKLGLDAEAIFAGMFARQELTDILTSTDIYVSSSILEGQSLALVEAMAHGCPIVATRVGGAAELIEHGLNGLLCPPADSEALAANIELLIESPELRAAIGREARRTYEGGAYGREAVSSFLEGVYHTAIHDPSR